jgi:tRNA (guanine37-N1)-methyltransferase
MRINVITIFPDIMEVIFTMGIMGIAKKKSLVEYRIVNPRDFTGDAHRTVDDAPYGGGPGMIMMVEPVYRAVESLGLEEGSRVVLMSPAGRRFDQRTAHDLAREEEITFVCGRYKGIDERIKELVVTDEISIGDFVLSGGEIAAAACIEAIVRLRKDVLGNKESSETDSFEAKRGHLLDCAYYTRPEEFMGLKVPDVLLSGDHKRIEKWRLESSLKRTKTLRPDLLEDEKDE